MVKDKSGTNYRYVFTKIDKKPQFLIMSKCNYCPFMINDFHNGDVKCSKFIDPKSSGIYKNFISFVYGYMQKGNSLFKMEALTRINIPYWCNLPDHLTEITPNDAIHTIVDGKLFIESGQNYSDNVQIISDDEVMFNREDCESLILIPKKGKYINYNGGKSTILTNTTTSFKDTRMCSSCGEDKEDVDREKHNGMCINCWAKFKRNKKKKYFSYINNFRLKRKESWKNEEYKIVKIHF